jgi:hypothetical protein
MSALRDHDSSFFLGLDVCLFVGTICSRLFQLVDIGVSGTHRARNLKLAQNGE